MENQIQDPLSGYLLMTADVYTLLARGISRAFGSWTGQRILLRMKAGGRYASSS